MPKYQAPQIDASPTFDANRANEAERRHWGKDSYNRKNQEPVNFYDFTRKKLNFEIMKGEPLKDKDGNIRKDEKGHIMFEKPTIIPLGTQPISLKKRFDNRLEEIGHKTWENAKGNQPNTNVSIVLSGDHDRMTEIAFGKPTDFVMGEDNSNAQLVTVGKNELEEMAKKYGVQDLVDTSREYSQISLYALCFYKFLSEKFGEENVIGLECHLDETTPHFHSLVVPVAEKKKSGRAGGYTLVDDNKNPVLDADGNEIHITTRAYERMPEEKRTNYVKTNAMTVGISYASYFGKTISEVSRSYEKWHDMIHEAVTKQWGFDRGERLRNMSPEERADHHRKSKKQLERERQDAEKRVKEEEEKEKEAKQRREEEEKHLNQVKEDTKKAVEEKNQALSNSIKGIAAKMLQPFGRGDLVKAEKKAVEEYERGKNDGIKYAIAKMLEKQNLTVKEGHKITIDTLVQYNQNIQPKTFMQAAQVLQKMGLLPNVEIPKKRFLTGMEFQELCRQGKENMDEKIALREKQLAEIAEEMKNEGARAAALKGNLVKYDANRIEIDSDGHIGGYLTLTVNDIGEMINEIVEERNELKEELGDFKALQGREEGHGWGWTRAELQDAVKRYSEQNSRLDDENRKLKQLFTEKTDEVSEHFQHIIDEVADEGSVIAKAAVGLFIGGIFSFGGGEMGGGGGGNNEGWRKKDDEDWGEYARRCHSAAKSHFAPKTNKNYRGPNR